MNFLSFSLPFPFLIPHTIQGTLTAREVFEVDRERLIVAHVTLLQQYRLYSQRNKDNLERIQRLQNELIEKNESDLKIAKLHEAHAAQVNFLMSLEEKCSQGKRYKCLVQRMEKTILELEQLVTTPDASRVAGWTSLKVIDSPSVSLLEAENALLEQHISRGGGRGSGAMDNPMLSESMFEGEGRESLVARLEAAQDRHAELKAERVLLRARGSDGGLRGNGGVVTQADRIEALQKEADEHERKLVAMTVVQSNELSRMLLQNLEMSTKAAGGFGNRSALLLNELDSPRMHAPPKGGSGQWPPPRLNPL